MRADSDSLPRFVLRVIAWLPLTFAVWYLAAPLLVWPVALLAELFTRSTFDWVKSVEQMGPLITFVTSLKPAEGANPAGVKAVISVESNVLLFSFGLPMLAALILAAREPHRVRMLMIGFVVLLPFQTFSVVADFLKNVAILAPPAVSSQTGINAFQREVIAFCYQFGTLILPTVAPAIVWVLMHRHFLEKLSGRDKR
ncbi:MAG TPA: exosortase H-associated membrane protein [Casimicrobiaceae bacterium]|nr:exosortase H-associated membrane protein [Casimicrobiaceae bacterium]